MDDEIEEKEKLKNGVENAEDEDSSTADLILNTVEEDSSEETEVVRNPGMDRKEQEKDVDDNMKDVEDLFADSTVRFLWAKTLDTNGQGRSLHLFDKLVAISIMVVQAALYAHLFNDAIYQFSKDQATVTVNSEDCKSKSFDNFGCDLTDPSLSTNVLAVLLFLAFIASDIGGAFRLVLTGGFWQGIAGTALLAETVVATLCCAAMAHLGGLESASSFILAAVAVSFIHDLDKKVRSVYEYCPTFKQVLLLSIWSIITAVGSLAVTLMYANWQQELNIDANASSDPT